MKYQSIRITLMLAVIVALVSTSAITVVHAAPGETIAAGASPAASVLWQGADAERIRFAPGATSAVVSGDLGARSSARYVLRALAGQLMEVNLTAPQGAALTVTTATGRVLHPATGGSTAFRGYLPRNEDYYLEIETGREAGSYSLSVSVPQRISFARGATSAVVEGRLSAHQSHDYILRAGAGQLMDIEVSPANSLQLIIYGVDGTVLRSGMGEGSSFRGELPSTQDYIVSLRAGDQAVSFTMNVSIPQRIRFARGAVSATVYGWVNAHESDSYVLRALEGQNMRVSVDSRNPVQLIIYGADGTVLRSGMGEGSSFNGELPSTQDYILVVRAGPNPAYYSLTVTIR